jgi:small nuclear ribonucleoprotein (snRNP)-like protein
MTDYDDPELDFFHPAFNPTKALNYRGNLNLPDPDALPLDNVYKARILLPADHPDARIPPPLQSFPSAAARPNNLNEARAGPSLADQAKHHVRAISKAEKINPLDQIASRVKEGPLLLLKRAYQQKCRVRVVTRHGHGVRGVAEGTLLGFDKHFNMILRDVEEKYTVLLRGVERVAGDKVRRGNRQDHRQRRLKQVLIRGEGVVLVSAL